LALAGPAISSFMLLRYGIRGVLVPTKPWRGMLLLLAFVAGLLGGFRSSVVMAILLFAILFYFEGLFRTQFVLVLLLGAVLTGATLVPLARHLPLTIQRSISFLPVEIDNKARSDAESTTEWRLRMWDVLLPQIPQYFWLGKGFAVSPTDLYLLQEAVLRGLPQDIDLAIAGGSYHNGPLTLIIPFGIFGLAGFLWFGIASLRVLHHHYRYSPPDLKLLNTFLLSYFLMRFIYFLVFYGQFAEDLMVFTGLVGLTVSINGAVRKNEPASEAVSLQPVLAEAAVV
jgi:hypothetical protein